MKTRTIHTLHTLSRSVVYDSLRPHVLQPTRLLCPWDSPGKNTGVGCHFLLQGIFPTQESNPGLPHCRQTQADALTSEPPGKLFIIKGHDKKIQMKLYVGQGLGESLAQKLLSSFRRGMSPSLHTNVCTHLEALQVLLWGCCTLGIFVMVSSHRRD